MFASSRSSSNSV